jgi:CDP-diglyceride synthetase
MHLVLICKLLVLLAVANGTPVIAKRILASRFDQPLDAGAIFIDGRRLFGQSKTLRGIVLAILGASAAAPLVGLDWQVGAQVGLMAMAGDLFSSFLKRRMNLAPSSQAIGLDQIPESLFALIAARVSLPLSALDIGLAVAAFLMGELLISRLLFALNIRDRPY